MNNNDHQKEVIDPGAKAKVLRFLAQNISPSTFSRRPLTKYSKKISILMTSLLFISLH